MSKCPYCSSTNGDGDHRCKRCGRRLDGNAANPDTLNRASRPSPGLPSLPSEASRYQHSATAAALDFDPRYDSASETPASADEHKSRRPVYQPSLFASPRVVSFESFAPEAVEPGAKKTVRPRAKPRKILPGQQSFSFDEAMQMDSPGYHGPAAPAEPVIECDAPVALPAHRMIAAAFDGSIVIVAVSLFFTVFHFAGGTIVLNKHTAPLLAAVAAVFYLFYKILWCLADGDTAGMRWAHLRLVNFDGQPPERDQRLYRIASGFLSLLAAGLGLLWALVDEESLTWHDHMSRTFPTPY